LSASGGEDRTVQRVVTNTMGMCPSPVRLPYLRLRFIRSLDREARKKFDLLRRRTPPAGPLPVPPLELRTLAGDVDECAYDNAAGIRVYESVAGSSDDSVLDFGCGCGRIAR
jgi:hypothetical protein